MTVAELIAELTQLDQNLKVVIEASNDAGDYCDGDLESLEIDESNKIVILTNLTE